MLQIVQVDDVACVTKGESTKSINNYSHAMIDIVEQPRLGLPEYFSIDQQQTSAAGSSNLLFSVLLNQSS